MPTIESRNRLPDETESKLLDAAGQVFAEAGFRHATVRDICARAGVNVAAVNYHFGDKQGLYIAVLNHSACFAEHFEVAELAVHEGKEEECLREFVRRTLSAMLGPGKPAWFGRIMAHELAEPSPALRHVVENALRPRYQKLRSIVAGLTGRPVSDESVRMCAHSIIAQCLHYMHARPVLAELWPELSMTPERIEKLSKHIADFSLAGLRGLSRERRLRDRKTSSRAAGRSRGASQQEPEHAGARNPKRKA